MLVGNRGRVLPECHLNGHRFCAHSRNQVVRYAPDILDDDAYGRNDLAILTGEHGRHSRWSSRNARPGNLPPGWRMGYGRTGRVPIWDPPVRNVVIDPLVRAIEPRYVATDACEQETDPDILLNYGPRPYEPDFVEEDDLDDGPFPFPVPVPRRRRRRVQDFFEEDDIHCDPAHHERGCRECPNCEGGQPSLIPAEEIIAHQQARLAAAARQAQIANLRTREEALRGRPPQVAPIACLDRELARRRRVRISNDLEADPYYRQERRRSPYRYTQDELYFSDDDDSQLSFGNRYPHERLLMGPPLRRALPWWELDDD